MVSHDSATATFQRASGGCCPGGEPDEAGSGSLDTPRHSVWVIWAQLSSNMEFLKLPRNLIPLRTRFTHSLRDGTVSALGTSNWCLWQLRLSLVPCQFSFAVPARQFSFYLGAMPLVQKFVPISCSVAQGSGGFGAQPQAVRLIYERTPRCIYLSIVPQLLSIKSRLCFSCSFS